MTTADTDKHLSIPDPLAHVECVRLRNDWLMAFVPAAILCAVLSGFFSAAILAGWHTSFIVAFGVALVADIGAVAQIGLSHQAASRKNDARFNEWKEHQRQLRDNSAARISQDPSITVKGNATANIGETINQLVVGDSKDLQRFIKHRREFLARVIDARGRDESGQTTGTERNFWLKATLDGKPYQWGDGTRIGAGEYEYLLETLEGTVYEPLGRKQGTRGQRQDVIIAKATPLLDTGEGVESANERDKSTKASRTSGKYKIIGGDST